MTNYKYDFRTFNVSLMVMRLGQQGISRDAVAELSGVTTRAVAEWVDGYSRPLNRQSIAQLMDYTVEVLEKPQLEECGIKLIDIERNKIALCFDGIIDEITKQSFGGSKMRITDLVNEMCSDLGIPEYHYSVDIPTGQGYRIGTNEEQLGVDL